MALIQFKIKIKYISNATNQYPKSHKYCFKIMQGGQVNNPLVRKKQCNLLKWISREGLKSTSIWQADRKAHNFVWLLSANHRRICRRRGILLVILWLFSLYLFLQTKTHCTDIFISQSEASISELGTPLKRVKFVLKGRYKVF